MKNKLQGDGGVNVTEDRVAQSTAQIVVILVFMVHLVSSPCTRGPAGRP